MLLSIVLPVYNVEDYLPKCIEKCENQDLQKVDYELIVVIDGSPDNSIEVAKKYQEIYTNIRVVTRENGGLSAARNTGLKTAEGDYVWFVDSDDYINNDILAGIASQLRENNLDALWLDWQDVNEEGTILPAFAPHAYRNCTNTMSGSQFMADVLSNYLYAWSFIYRRTFLLSNNLLFTEGMYYEDTDFAFRSLPLIKRIKKYNKVCYNYLQREGSIVHNTSMRKLEDICKNCVSATMALKDCLPDMKRFYKMCFTGFYMLFVKEVIKSNNKEYAEFLISQTKRNGFGKVYMFGNIKTKFIGLLYNILGIKATYKILSLLL